MDLRSGSSWWLVTNGLPRSYPALRHDLDCDVVVMGAGITGALTASRLRRAGLDVVVLDRREVATGSTAASTALLQYETDRDLADLVRRRGERVAVDSWRAGREAVSALGDALGADGRMDCDWDGSETLYLASQPRDTPGLRREARLRARHGFDVDIVENGALPAAWKGRVACALHSAGAAVADPYRLTHWFLADAANRGAGVFDRSEVMGIDGDIDGDAGVTLSVRAGGLSAGSEANADRRWRVRAKRLVVCAGYESERWLTEHLPVDRDWRGRPHVPGARTALRSTYAVISEPGADRGGWPTDSRGRPLLVWETARPYVYARFAADGRLAAGGLDVPRRSAGRLREGLPDAAARIMEHVSTWNGGALPEPAFAWAGTFGETADSLPYLAPHPKARATFVVMAYGGNGSTFAAIGAELATAWATGRTHRWQSLFEFGRA